MSRFLTREAVRKSLPWVALVAAFISLGFWAYVQMIFAFVDETIPSILILMSMATGVLALILALVSLPSWQSSLSLIILGYLTYRMLFTPLYGLI